MYLCIAVNIINLPRIFQHSIWDYLILYTGYAVISIVNNDRKNNHLQSQGYKFALVWNGIRCHHEQKHGTF